MVRPAEQRSVSGDTLPASGWGRTAALAGIRKPLRIQHLHRLEPGGLEPPTFCMPCRRAPNCAMAPCGEIMDRMAAGCNSLQSRVAAAFSGHPASDASGCHRRRRPTSRFQPPSGSRGRRIIGAAAGASAAGPSQSAKCLGKSGPGGVTPVLVNCARLSALCLMC